MEVSPERIALAHRRIIELEERIALNKRIIRDTEFFLYVFISTTLTGLLIFAVWGGK